MKKRDDADAAEEEERAVSIVANLFAGLAKPARRDRLAAKFVEAEFEKCDRLMEVFFRHRARVAAEERRCGAREGWLRYKWSWAAPPASLRCAAAGGRQGPRGRLAGSWVPGWECAGAQRG